MLPHHDYLKVQNVDTRASGSRELGETSFQLCDFIKHENQWEKRSFRLILL